MRDIKYVPVRGLGESVPLDEFLVPLPTKWQKRWNRLLIINLVVMAFEIGYASRGCQTAEPAPALTATND